MSTIETFRVAPSDSPSPMRPAIGSSGTKRWPGARSRRSIGLNVVLLALACAFGPPARASGALAHSGDADTAQATSLRFSRAGAGGDQPLGCATSSTVTNANDSGSGSLRQAVLGACVDGVIDFSSRFEIQLLSEIVIDKALTISGASVSNPQAGADQSLVQIKGGADVRAFNVGASGDLTLVRVRISNGVMTGTGIAGGILNAGLLRLSECRLDGNRSGSTSQIGGGAITNDVGAELYVERSTFDHNVSHRGAAIFNSGEATFFNSTFSANTTDNGAEVREGAIQNRGSLAASHITVTGNGSGGTAGGLFAFSATTLLVNSILAGNDGADCFNSGSTFNSVSLLKQTGNCASEISGDPALGTLADNGGVTATHALRSGSAAIGAGNSNFCLDTDQRGVERTEPNRCDVGAFELGDTLFTGGFD